MFHTLVLFLMVGVPIEVTVLVLKHPPFLIQFWFRLELLEVVDEELMGIFHDAWNFTEGIGTVPYGQI